MATLVFDKKEAAKVRWCMPLTPPGGASPTDAMRHPGNCVKSRETEPRGLLLRYGRIVKYSNEAVVIVSHNYACCEDFVWTGTSAEYYAVWDCD